MSLAVAVLAAVVAGTHVVLRRRRERRSVQVTGWAGFAGDTLVCALALSAVADDPIDPIVAITLMVAIEAAVRWGTRGAVFGGLVAGTMALAWAAAGYEAIGRDLPATSMAFRLVSPVVVALPVGLLIAQLRRQRAHTRRLFEHSSDATLILAGRRIVAVNPAAAELVHEPVERLVGERFADSFGPLFEVGDPEDLLRVPEEERRAVVHEEGDGQRWLAIAVEMDEDADLTFVTIRDVTEQQTREADLRFRAWHDQLTALPNRAALQSKLAESDLGRRTDLGVVVLDLDDFKIVNDVHGHVAGDDLLAEVADRLRQITRDTDTAYRWAGDEFCLVVDPASPAVLAAVTERIAETFDRGFHLRGETVRIQASVGSAMAQRGDTAQDLLARADEMMYRTKQTFPGTTA